MRKRRKETKKAMKNEIRQKKKANLRRKILGGTLLAAGISSAGLYLGADAFCRKAVVRQKPSKRKGKFKKEEGFLVSYPEESAAGKEWLHGQKLERITIESFDGLQLAADFLSAPDARGTVLLVHGYRSTPAHCFSCLAKYYHEKGLNLLLIYNRACGPSEGKYITMGAKESHDIADWADWTEERFGSDRDIFLHGISMGATAVLLASRFALPQNVRGIIADCGFTSPHDIFSHVLKTDYHLPKFPLFYLVEFLIARRAKFRLKMTDTRRAMQENRIPVLFIHGGSDDFVPASMSLENYRACAAEKMLYIVEEAKHGEASFADWKGYTRALEAFFRRFGRNSGV